VLEKSSYEAISERGPVVESVKEDPDNRLLYALSRLKRSASSADVGYLRSTMGALSSVV
jgi:hypothetical protein